MIYMNDHPSRIEMYFKNRGFYVEPGNFQISHIYYQH